MKKYLQKTLMVMLAAFLSLSFASCSSDDDEGNGGKGGKMSGWVEIDGKKYNFSYFFGYKSHEQTEMAFTGFSKNPYSMNQSETVNMANLSILLVPDGSKLDTDLDRLGVTFEFNINANMSDNVNPKMVMYCSNNTSLAGMTASRTGDKYTIDGKNVEARYSKPGVGSVGSSDPTTTINFHFEGTPQWIDDDFDYD